MAWHFRGTPHFLRRHAARMSLSPMAVKSAETNREIYRIATLISQLCDRWHRTRKEDGVSVFGFNDLAQVKEALLRQEVEASKLFALAASAHDMLDEAWREWGFDPPVRRFAILSDFDDVPAAPPPNGVSHHEPSTPGTTTAKTKGK